MKKVFEKNIMKNVSKGLVIALSFATAVTCFSGVLPFSDNSQTVYAEEASWVYYGSEDGKGNNSVYALEVSSGFFIVGGTGMYEEKPVGERDWEEHIDKISTIVNNDSPSGVPAQAFANSSVQNVNLSYAPGLTVIGNSAFKGCKKLTSAVLPDGLTTIGNSAFSGCSSLKEIEIPASVTSLGTYAFSSCTSLEKVTIHSDCAISEYAFLNCPNLKEVIIDGNVTEIGDEAFRGDSSLASFDFSNIKSIGHYSFRECSALKSIDLSSVETMNTYAFTKCSGLETVTLPKKMTTLPSGTLSDCTSLKEVEIPSNIKEFGARVLGGCTSLEKVTFDGEMTAFGNYVFSGCTSLDNVVLPEGLKELKSGCFENCTGLTNVTFPSTLTTIGNSAFVGCSGFTEFTIPNQVKLLGSDVFSNCENLKKLIFDSDDVAKNDVYITRYSDAVETLVLTKNVTSFLPDTMYYLQSVKNVEVEEGNPKYTAIDGVLVDKETMTIVSYPKAREDQVYVVPDGIKGMGYKSIPSYGSLAYIYLPEGFETLDDYAIKTSISKIYIPKSLTSIQPNSVPSGTRIYFEGSEEEFKNALGDGEDSSIIDCVKEYDHEHKESVINDTSSCTRDGEKTYGCTCGILPERVEEIKAPGHIMVLKSAGEPTTSYPGSIVYECENCSYTVHNGIVAKVNIEKVERKTTGIDITWEIIDYANYYDIYRSVNGGTYELIKTIQWNEGPKTYSYLDATATSKTACYSYKMRARSTWISNPTDGEYSDVYPSIGMTTVSSLSNVATGIKISWKKDSNATGYYIYRSKDGGSYSKIATISKNSTVTYTDAKATTNGAKYTYRIYAYKTVNGKTYKSVTPTAKKTYRVSRPSLSSAKCTARKTITATWKKNSKASGYQIKLVQGTSTKTYTISKNSTLKKKITNLKKGKTYKVYIRSYKTVSGTKYYSAWSAAKSVKVTK